MLKTKPTISIVIPTHNHCYDLLQPCLESLVKYNDLDNIEIIIVSNGSTDETGQVVADIANALDVKTNSMGDIFKLIYKDEPLGYTKSTNIGIKASQGEFVCCLNNDTVILHSPKNYVFDEMMKPFSEDPKMGITGCLMSDCQYSGSRFLIFCFVIIKREVIDTIGILDEIWQPGFGEDSCFCIRAQRAGYHIQQVPKDEIMTPNDELKVMVGTLPFYHRGNATFEADPGYQALIARNRKYLTYRYNTHPLKLNLGCGNTPLEGYVNIDLYHSENADIVWDIKNLNIFLNDTVDEIYTNHVFEHLDPNEAHTILREWLRVLKPGATLHIEIPDIMAICKEIVTEGIARDRLYGLMNAIYGGANPECPHRFGWERSMLAEQLWATGYVNIREIPAKQGWVPSIAFQGDKPIKPMIYDCMMFFNELDILEIRLNTLDKVVDKFVIVEATTTHRSQPKPLYFNENKERFARFLHKIIHVVVDDLPNNPQDSWGNERFQRDCIMRGLTQCKGDDIIIVGDADEIANPDAIKRYKPEMGLMRFDQYCSYYYLNCINVDTKWDLLKILPYKLLKEITPCGARYKSYESKNDEPFLEDGGWHFSFAGDVDHIIQKIKAFAHHEYDFEEYTNREHVKQVMKTGEDIFKRPDIRHEFRFIDTTFPTYIIKNEQRLIAKGLIKVPDSFEIDRMTTMPQGWFSQPDIDSYRNLVRDNIPDGGKLVEIGTWKGRSLCSLSDIIRNKNLEVTAIDTFVGTISNDFEKVIHAEAQDVDIKQVFEDNLKFFRIQDNVTVIKNTSLEAVKLFPDNHFDFGFVDADHEYNAFKADLDEWYKKVKPGGILAGHDYKWPGVRRALDEKFGSVENNWGNIWFVKKSKTITLEEARTTAIDILETAEKERSVYKDIVMDEEFVPVTVEISTKNRYNELALALVSIAQQSVLPKEIIIFDDNDEKDLVDLRELPIYQNLFSMLMDKGINWIVQYGKKMGQVANHQTALEIAKYPFIFRCDDDHVLEPNVIGALYDTLISNNKIGAVGGLVYHPGRTSNVSNIASNKLADIYLGANLQWYKNHKERLIEVEHLYSTFMFRKEAAGHGYNLSLSRVGHREESLLTGQMFINGWQLYINTETIIWHFQGEGGIRSYKDPSMYQHDEEIFASKMKEWGIEPTKYKIIALDCGMGDMLCFVKILPEVIEKYKKDHTIVLSVCYPEVFETFTTPEDYDILKIISIADAMNMGIDSEQHQIYKYLWHHKDQGIDMTLEQAYRRMYLDE